MIWTVVWFDSAQNHLADLWMQAPDRAAVSAAANAMDQSLRRDPYQNSESRIGNNRIMFAPPLGISFDISEEDRLVTVWPFGVSSNRVAILTFPRFPPTTIAPNYKGHSAGKAVAGKPVSTAARSTAFK